MPRFGVVAIQQTRGNKGLQQLVGVAFPLRRPGYISGAYVRDVAVWGIIESPEPERSQEPDHIRRIYFEIVGGV